MPGSTDPGLRRQYSLLGYDHRYGFNGKEGDDEVKGDDNQQDYGMRIYDPRAGRFLSVDPIAREYPWYTPYQFAGNKPIWAVDLDGLEEATIQQLESAKKYYKNTELSKSTCFTNIDNSLINKQVLARLTALGNPISQGAFSLCGPAAACHIAASHDPENYVKTVFDLYQNGSANKGQIVANKAIRDGKPDNNGNIDGIPAIDWILLHSLRNSENLLGGYDPHKKDDWSKMTLMGEFPDLIERLGSNVNVIDDGMVDDSPYILGTLIPWLDSGKRAVFFVDSRQYSGGAYEDGVSEFVSRNYGRHFIVAKGLIYNVNGSIDVKYWDKGRDKVKTTNFKSFRDFSDATMNSWRIEQNSNSNEKD